MQKSLAILSASVVLFAAGCSSDKGTGPAGAVSGTVTFNYTGGGGGTFNVTGTVPALSANIGNNNWGAGYRDTPNTTVEVVGVRARSAGRYDIAAVSIPRLTVGSASINSNCNPDVTACASMLLLVNGSQNDSNFDFLCMLETGSMAISSLSSSRVQGSFSGTGSCFTATGTTTTFSVTGGSFDVPLVTNLPT